MSTAAEPNVVTEPTLHTPELIPLSDLLILEEGFNSRRDKITPLSVKDLMEDMKLRGLDQPIHVRPLPEGHPTGKKFTVIAGFRRTRSAEWLGWPTIPAFIRTDVADDFDARMFNIRENFQRKDLSIIDQAYALRPFLERGFPSKWIAAKLAMPKRWVDYLIVVGGLPNNIQDEIAANPTFFKQGHIEKLADMTSLDEQMEYVKSIKKHAFAGDSLPVRGPNKSHISDKRKRSVTEMMDLLDSIYDTFGPGIQTRLLAWAAGNISNFDIIQDLNKLAVESQLIFIAPETLSEI